MSEEEKEALRYRFGGYKFARIQLDETGDGFIVSQVHPYYYNQPDVWSRGHFYGHPNGNYNVRETNGRLFPFLNNDENT